MAPLVAVALGVAPIIAEALFGRRGGVVAEAAGDIVRAVTGTDDPDQARLTISTDPTKREELQMRLAELAGKEREAERAAQAEELRALIADVADARAMSLALADKKHPLSWGAAVVSGIVLALFSFIVVVEGLRIGEIPDPTRRLVEYALIAVLGYWVGSSAGSATKERLMRGVASSANGQAARRADERLGPLY